MTDKIKIKPIGLVGLCCCWVFTTRFVRPLLFVQVCGVSANANWKNNP